MIAYADFEFAMARWKARAAGVPQPAAPAVSGAVAAPMPVSTAPEDVGDYGEAQPQRRSSAAIGVDEFTASTVKY